MNTNTSERNQTEFRYYFADTLLQNFGFPPGFLKIFICGFVCGLRMEEDLVQPAKGTALKVYYQLRFLFMVGFLEMLLGATVVVLEVAAIWMFYDDRISYPLEIVGIIAGICFINFGGVCLVAGRDRVLPQTRHKLFIAGCVLSLFAFVVAAAMLVLSVMRAHYLWKDVDDKKHRLDPDGKSYRDVAYALSLEGMSHNAILRSITAVVYVLLTAMFFLTMIVCGVNINKNQENLNSSVRYAAVNPDANPFKFPSNLNSHR